MKASEIGMFWQDTPEERAQLKKSYKAWGAQPPIPATGWRPPSEFPNLSAAKVIGVDTETYDPELLEAGPGWGRGKGHIIGASISVADGTSWYFPIAHGIVDGKQTLPPEHASMNMDRSAVLGFLDSVLSDSRPKVGANLIYDVGWLNWGGVRVAGPLYDIQFAEALLNSEEPDVSLDSLALRYLGVGKQGSALYDWLSRWNKKPANDRQRGNLFLSPPSLAGPYAEADASLPIQVLEKQWPLMAERGVLDLFHLECRLIPLLVKMRLKGAPVDVAKAEEAYDKLGGRLVGVEAKLRDIAGMEVRPSANETIAAAFNKLGIPIPQMKDKKTGLMRVSFAKPLLKSIDHPLVKAIIEHREIFKVQGTFLQSYVMEKNVKGRLHCSFNPLKSDGKGTRSGRFSSSDPNLQNIPVRTEEGKIVRAVFRAELGKRWRSFDYSSIEYRLLAHYAVGAGSDEVRAIYAADPKADYHKIVGKMILDLTGLDLERGKVKTINFGIIYGMQLHALSVALGLSKPEATKLLDDYHAAAPYARATMDVCADEVNRTGHITTILGRKSDFNKWGSKEWTEEGRVSLDYEAACRKWGRYNIERSATHKALNRRLQGSAADVMKKAMVDAYEAGLFEDDACGMPILTVHDELDFEDEGDLDNPAWAELTRVMENCTAHLLKVPLLVEGGYGPSWAEAH